MTSAQKLEQIFGLSFQQQPDITALRQFRANNTFCEDEQGNIIGLCACENDFEAIELPASVTQTLEYLNLSDNGQFRRLSFEGALPVLKHLDISDSKLEALSLPAAEQLNWLDVSRNRLKALTFSGDLPGLRYLDLSDNQIETLDIPDAPSLKHLYAQKNRLTNFAITPQAVSLEVLHLKDNQLDVLPLSLVSLSKLEALYVHGNPLSSLPQSSIAAGENESSLENIRNYLLSITKDTTIDNDEIKMVLLGNSTAGKSSLLHFLLKGTYDKQLSSTHGIQNEIWELEDGRCKVNIWDFGGQEFYHATHRLFLSENAVTLVVFEQDTNIQEERPTHIKLYHGGQLREEEILLQHFPVSYWLDSVQHFCRFHRPEATALVQTKMDKEQATIIPISDVDKQKFQLRDENIFRISVEGAHNRIKKYVRTFDNFKEDLEDILHEVKSSYQISTKWLDIKEELRTLGQQKTMLSRAEYIGICEEISPGISGPPDETVKTMLDTVTEYLHGISVILYYPDIEALKDIIFINPQWITNVIYKVLDFEVKENEGKFKRAHIEAIIQQDELAGDLGADQLIALMKQFELIFQVKNEPDQFIAAQYLPKENPEKNSKSYLKLRNRCDQHAFTIRYPVFMPRSAITRLICRYGNLAEDVFWRNGIVFEKDGITVHLECGEDRKVKVDMDQLHPTVAYDIFNNMQEINQRHADLEVSGNGADFVRIANLQEHPATNPQIRATNHNWLPIEDFQIIMGGHGTHQEFEAVHHHVPRPRGAAKTNASRIYFSYAWADQREGGSDHQRRIVDQLYDSLREDGHQVLRDNMDLEYGGLISKYMQELGRGDLILVFLSDAYVRSPYCMYELCEISRNQKREQELFRTRILPVPLEHISFDKPKVLKPYIGYWKNELKEWEELIKDDTDYISGQQFKRYEYTREITRQFGELSDWLIDINASRIDLLTADNFAVIKTAIKKRLEQMNE